MERTVVSQTTDVILCGGGTGEVEPRILRPRGARQWFGVSLPLCQIFLIVCLTVEMGIQGGDDKIMNYHSYIKSHCPRMAFFFFLSLPIENPIPLDIDTRSHGVPMVQTMDAKMKSEVSNQLDNPFLFFQRGNILHYLSIEM